jgi:hypothetical protein
VRFVLVSLVFASVSLAQPRPTPKPKPQVVNFENDLITGVMEGPANTLVTAKPQSKFERLFKVRTSTTSCARVCTKCDTSPTL